MQDYHDLEIWHRAMAFAVEIYKLSTDLPDSERYNLSSQLRKAASSIPLNIAEGSGCSSKAEFARFLGYAYRSVKEVVTCLELCERLPLSISTDSSRSLRDEGDQLARMIYALIRRLGTVD